MRGGARCGGTWYAVREVRGAAVRGAGRCAVRVWRACGVRGAGGAKCAAGEGS
ncbi:hypothetical protein SLNWT_5144 [Streptomyces albus]|uniref:Uncharacterized protein n=1 Tax=Streptomyces albus (strain ATCC 21838 / DSM 41398 / FERM P-419 / JCM 4703 / NBRC 107858) TaxID=1081613 RepID=A0A0B5F1Q4_STRA4|nr:hypothetical protein SLNWT_5144 [Streptomyces albus]AOU79824.1 hypothetical protein SLNHY_5133 [Streptomyces albus]AYN35547.1 hypothetical protein DUI70_5049 [Streptomyces albus]